MHNSDFLGKEPVGRLLWRLMLPSCASITINCLYNLVDRLYIGRGVGADAMAGLSLTFPYMIILAAFGMMVGMGSGAVISILLGEQRKEDAEKVLGQAVAMCLLFLCTFQFIALWLLDSTLHLFGGTEQAIPYARDYLTIILWGNIFQHISFGMSNLVRAEGQAVKAMGIIALGAGLNIALDPLFIFVLNMGIKGAAYATVLAMMCSSTWVMLHFILGRGTLKLHWRNIRIYPRLFWRVVSIGISPCLMQIVHSGVVILYNHSFRIFAETPEQATHGIAAFGIVNTVMMFLLMPTFGISQGAQPIFGYNTGSRQFDRVMHALRLAGRMATLCCLTFALLLFLCAPWVSLCFTNDPALLEITKHGLRVNSLGLTFIGIGIITGNYFQSAGRASIAIAISLSRQILILAPVLLTLPRFYGFKGVWWSAPVSDTLCGVTCFVIVAFELLRLNRLQKQGAPASGVGAT